MSKLNILSNEITLIIIFFSHKNINNYCEEFYFTIHILLIKNFKVGKMSGTNDIVLFVNNLKKHFEQVKAVDGISFSVRKGEIYGLLGPNGAGKTTAIKTLIGLLDPDEGQIELLGVNPFVENNENRVKSLIGYVSEEPLLYKSLTPRELFNFIISVRQLDISETTRILNNLMESFETNQYYDSPIITLSKGNKQKMQIIAALLHDPELLIMDEPLAGLDAKMSRVMKDILRIHVSNGGGVLLSTHIMEVAQNLCTRIGIIDNGKLVAEGTLDELREVAQAVGASLEDVFLKLTEEDASVNSILVKLKETLK
ncbi:MAG: ABC transporter ATP-binding protein [Candidatus Lokiarchaeota archaeon]|nr:ABC transporter ATP-binding protein [Candidatus Lokiarchaeota archaeon]